MENKILKTIYFVRHGKTEGNEKNVYQTAETPLSLEGEEQAAFVAERFKKVHAEALLASDYARTKQTAEKISEKNGLAVEYSPLFREIRRPSEIIGKEKRDPSAKKIFDEIVAHETDPSWHYSDEENLFDAEKRAREALQFLRERKESSIIAVTHEMFLKMLISAMAEQDEKRAVDLSRTIRWFMLGENTGITVAEYGDFGFGEKFRLHIWNDHSHLG